tara:strand:- start:27 stop:206 length:180 start_codon:yes stop_codon:yes gene_type:complete
MYSSGKIEEEAERKIMEREKMKAFKMSCSDLRHERRTIGIKFWDPHGTGRIVKGKKVYV